MRVFSGIQPTGEIHIGNYLGAIKQWVELQHQGECLFCIVDLHSLTIPYSPQNLGERVFEKVIAYLAAGIDPKKSIIFIQSQVKEHTELCWLLSVVTPVGELQRMTQFKEKARKHKKNVNAGLLNYPILMASDILLYQTDVVPVGKDQLQHVELTRDIAKRFNARFGQTFKIPHALLPRQGAKIMSLTNPEKKMSKSDSPNSYLGLFDPPELIRQKIMAAVTDPGKEIKYDPTRKKGISNLIQIYSLFSGMPIKKVEEKFKQKGYKDFKLELANLLIQKLEPFRRKKKEFLNRKSLVKEILETGRKRAQIIAKETMEKVRQKMGLNF